MDEKLYDLLEKLYFEVQSVKSELKADIQSVKSELKADIQEVKDTMATKADLDMVRDELKTEIESVHNEVKQLREDLSTMELIATKNSYDIARLKVLKGI